MLPKRLSVQQILDCSGFSNGCNGGYSGKSYDYMQFKGVQLDRNYPYEERVSLSNDLFI